MAFSSGCTFSSTYSIDAARRLFATNRDAVVVIESDGRVDYEAAIRVSSHYVATKRIFLTSAYLPTYRVKISEDVGGYFHRRGLDPSADVYSRVVSGAMQTDQSGFESFSSSNRKIKISRVSHKTAAVQAFRRYLEKAGFSGRLESLVSQSVDELLTNAIFDAPVLETGLRPLHSRPRHLEIQLDDHEVVEMKLASNSKYIVVSVTDKYGSFEREDFIRLILNAPGKAGKATEFTGLKGIYQSGISMCFNANPGRTTEITLVIPKVTNYKEIQNWFSVFADDL